MTFVNNLLLILQYTAVYFFLLILYMNKERKQGVTLINFSNVFHVASVCAKLSYNT